MSRVGFIGAGRMGTPMVGRLAEAGHEVRALARTPEKGAALQHLGAEPVGTIEAAADGADLVIVCVFTDEQVQQVCMDSDLFAAMKPGAALVIHTTGSPDTAVAIGASANRHVIDVVDAPVSGGPHDVAAGQVTVFLGGADDVVGHVTPVLSSYADPVLHVGPLGAGQRVKLINNALFAAQIGLVAETVRIGNRLGITEPVLLWALSHGSAGSRALGGIAAAGSVATFITAVGDFIGKDVAVIRKTAAELGVDLGPLDDAVTAGLPS